MLNQHYGVVLYGNNRFLNTDFGFLNCKKKIFHVYSASCNHMQIRIFAKISKRKIERE